MDLCLRNSQLHPAPKHPKHRHLSTIPPSVRFRNMRTSVHLCLKCLIASRAGIPPCVCPSLCKSIATHLCGWRLRSCGPGCMRAPFGAHALGCRACIREPTASVRRMRWRRRAGRRRRDEDAARSRRSSTRSARSWCPTRSSTECRTADASRASIRSATRACLLAVRPPACGATLRQRRMRREQRVLRARRGQRGSSRRHR